MLGCCLQDPNKLLRAYDPHRPACLQLEQMVVAGDEVLSLCGDGAVEYQIVGRIFLDQLEMLLGSHPLGERCQFGDGAMDELRG